MQRNIKLLEPIKRVEPALSAEPKIPLATPSPRPVAAGAGAGTEDQTLVDPRGLPKSARAIRMGGSDQ